MKVCNKCEIEKEVNEFGNQKRNKDGLKGHCNACQTAIHKLYRQENKESIASKKKEYNQANKESIAAKAKEYSQENKEVKAAYIKEYQKENREKIAAYMKGYQTTANKQRRDKRKTDPLFVLKSRLRCRTRVAFTSKSYKKTSHTHEMLGAEWEIVKKHIERQFSKGMNWGNMSDWHIDHVIPLSSAKNEKELMNLSHYTNLKPLWVIDNLEKSDKIIEGTQNNLRL